ncbi:MAG: sigma-70 factor domain-containing protein, partial [Chloroflexota bacterium]
MPKSTTRHDDNTAEVQKPLARGRKAKDNGGNGNMDTPNTEFDVALHSDTTLDTASAPESTSARKGASARRASNGNKTVSLLEDDPSVYEEDITYASKADRDSSSLDDLDRAERFDLNDTQFRNGNRSVDNISIVEVIDDTYDNLGLTDEASILPKLARAISRPRRAGRANPSQVAVDGDDAEHEPLVVLEVDLEAADDVEEEEPDPVELADAAVEVEVVEVEHPEELERFIDRVLSMESVSVDDPVRIYLREIGRTALLKSPDESALAEKMAVGHKAAEELEQKGINLKLLEDLSARQPLGEEESRILAQDETRVSILAYREGKAAKQKLVQANLRLVVSIARRYIGRGL